MHDQMISELNKGLSTAFIDGSVVSDINYRPEFISNNPSVGKKVISSIEDELLSCDFFRISVAFITLGGLEPLLMTLKELERRGIKGEVLTTNYQHFTQPRALRKLSELKNITLKMYDSENGEQDKFHTKGYIFKREEVYHIIIGSSNMTKSALTVNKEWNTKIVSSEDGEVVRGIISEFDELWNSERALLFNDFIDTYEANFKIIEKQKKIARSSQVVSIKNYTLRPNSMQSEFINSLQKMVQRGESRALLLSSTGTGKTYASAFALREIFDDVEDKWISASESTGRALFLVHREQIAKQALKSYRRVFGDTKTLGLISGNVSSNDKIENAKADIIFATIQTMSKPEYYELFDEESFDVIVLDEAHHTAGDSYQRVMDYFNPRLWIGMTATPDRMDGYDVYEVFDHNIACEIRLQQAMENDLLCPFHYFGITDIEIDGYTFSDDDYSEKNEIRKLRSFNYLTSDARVDYVIEQANYYGYSGDRCKGLIFVSRREIANELSRKFNERGLRTAVLGGDDSQAYREKCINKLTMDIPENDMANKEKYDYLDYIITVDIFNEGVDIPEVNQVIMLRPTESPIVFVQQLGRGLRKYEDKEFVVILDFIGNYKNNFMIPIALSGDRTYNKDTIRRYLGEGNRVIPGASSIHFDEVSKKRIYEAIDQANFTDIKLIKENYTALKNKLGRIPSLADFDLHGEMDVLRIFDNKSLGSYYKFLVKYEKEYSIRISKDEEQVIEFISRKLASGKRIHELELIKRLMKYAKGLGLLGSENSFPDFINEMYGKTISDNQKDNIINVLSNEFATGSGKNTFDKCVLLEKDSFEVSKPFAKMLKNEDFYKILEELVEFGISRYKRDYSDTYKDTDLVLYQKYTYEDVCRLLNWENNEVPLNIGGYKFDKKTKTFPVFINYNKEDNISDTIKYADHFTSNSSLIAISKSGRSLASDDVQNFLYAEERGIRVPLFVRKNKDDKISKEFYFLGEMKASGRTKEFVMENTDKSAVEIEWILDQPVREDLYEYLIG